MSCPRCGSSVRPPGLWSDSFICPDHGAVAPLRPAVVGSDQTLAQVAARSQVPLWLPWPLPAGWLVTGVRSAGGEHTGPVATVLAVSGPNPIVLDDADPLAADALFVAEQPGVGLAAHLAGLRDLDPGAALASGQPDAYLVVMGHETPMWSFAIGEDGGADAGVAYVGEARGDWLWVLTWPRPAFAVLLEQFTLVDLREPAHTYDIGFGALSPRLG
jgi:hypothetical protein